MRTPGPRASKLSAVIAQWKENVVWQPMTRNWSSIIN